MNRVTGQLLAACDALEHELARRPLVPSSIAVRQAGVTVAVAWHFVQQMLPEVVHAANYRHLREFSSAAERLPEFTAAPHGEGTYRDDG